MSISERKAVETDVEVSTDLKAICLAMATGKNTRRTRADNFMADRRGGRKFFEFNVVRTLSYNDCLSMCMPPLKTVKSAVCEQLVFFSSWVMSIWSVRISWPVN